MIALLPLSSALAVASLSAAPAPAPAPQVSDLRIQIVDAQGLPVDGTTLFVTDSDGFTIVGELAAPSQLTVQALGGAVTLTLPTLGKEFGVPLTEASGTAVTLQVGRAKDAAAVTSIKPFDAFAQPLGAGGGGPVNDDCANALPITDGDTAFSTLGATTDGTVGTNENDVWYAYTATCSGIATFSTCDQADYDTDLLLLTSDSSCGAQTLLAFNDDGAGCADFSSLMTASVTAGETYLLSVGGFDGASSGTGTISVSCQSATANDVCAAAELVAVGGSVTFDNSANTNDPSDPDFSCIFQGPGPGFGSTWFSFVAETASAELDTSLSQGSEDTVIGVYSGSCGSLVEIGCGEDIDFDGLNFLSNVVVGGLTPGEVYLVQVSTFNNLSAGEITLTIDNGPPLVSSNGSGINTATLSSSDALVAGQSFTATTSPAGPSRLFFSLSDALIPLPPLGELLIGSPIGFVPSLSGTYNLIVPDDNSLVGQVIYMQAVTGGALTNSLSGTIGE